MSINKNKYHWTWCLRGSCGQIKEEYLESLHENCPPCMCVNITNEMPFIRLSWLLDKTTDLTNLPRMQELPNEAFIFPNEMKYAYFISHRWLSQDHPDRSGGQLAVALSSVWAYVAESGPVEDFSKIRGIHQTGIWYDYLCLPQHPRSRSDQTLFNKLFPQLINLPGVTTPIVVINGEKEYATRAWCVAESLIAWLSGHKVHAVSLSMLAFIYEEYLCSGKSAWSINTYEKRGYRAGLAKLQFWLKQNKQVIQKDSDQSIKDSKKHVESIDTINTILLEIAGRDLDRTELYINDNILLNIASKFKLKTTLEEDLLICMRMIIDGIRYLHQIF